MKLLDPKGKWGVYDFRDRCWLGQGEGPNRYSDKETARLAATIATEMLGRLVVPRPIPKKLRYKDEIEARFDGVEAIRRIEGQ